MYDGDYGKVKGAVADTANKPVYLCKNNTSARFMRVYLMHCTL